MRETKYYLRLTEEEARWLKAVMKNPLHGVLSQQEDPQSMKMRKAFWNALPDELIR